MKYVKVDYIESGTFQGFEGDVSEADIDHGEECVVLKSSDMDEISSDAKLRLQRIQEAWQ